MVVQKVWIGHPLLCILEIMIDTVRLGRSGLKVSEVCLGTMTFGRESDKTASYKMLDYFSQQGGFFVDTANGYSNGASEELVGDWMADRGVRDQTILATKVFAHMGPGPNDGGLSRFHIMREVEASLRRLKTDVIDLYQIHRWYTGARIEETARALDDLLRHGKVRYLGCSNLRGYQLASYLKIMDELGFDRFVSIQPAYNAINRSAELEILPLVEQEGLGVVSYNPLAGGLLTGKYSRGRSPETGTRMQAYEYYYRRYFTDDALALTSRFAAHAKAVGMTPAQLALAWVMADDRITAPIIGARSLEQLTDSLGAVDHKLSAEERDAVPAMPPGRWVGEDPVYDQTAYK